MKKTLLITMDFYPSIGGISHYWEQFSQHMSPQEWVVLAPQLPVGVSEKTTLYTLYRRSFFSKLFFPRWIPLIVEIIRIVKKEKIRCIIVGQVVPVGSAVYVVSLLMGIPYVVSLHGMDLGMTARNRRKYFLARVILKKARLVIVNSSDTAQRAVSFGVGLQSIKILYPCADIPQDIPHIPDEKNYPVLLTVSRLVSRKGIQYVIEALPRIIQVFPHCRYVVIGGGKMLRELKKDVLSHVLSDHVEFVGSTSKESKTAYYRECDIFVMTPFEDNGDVEGFGMVYLEANSFGKPVIGTKSGGIADAVIRLAGDPSLAQRLGAQGKSRVKQDFQWSVQAKKLEKILTYL